MQCNNVISCTLPKTNDSFLVLPLDNMKIKCYVMLIGHLTVDKFLPFPISSHYFHHVDERTLLKLTEKHMHIQETRTNFAVKLFLDQRSGTWAD